MTLPKVIRCISALITVAWLSSCGPSPEAVAAASGVVAPASQGATIKVYRSLTAPVASAARVYVDDAFLGYVSSRSQNTFHVKPGTYRLSVKYPTAMLMMPHRSKSFTLSKGDTVHFGIGFGGGGEILAFSLLNQLNEEEASRANSRFPSRE